MKIRIVEGLIICTIYSLVLKMAEILFDRLAFYGDALLIAGWIVILAFVLLKSRSKILAFKTTGRLLSFLHFNNPDLFPELNETALKKHIKKKITNTPFGEIIAKISLYESNVHGFKYQLIVEVPEYHKGFSKIVKNWDTEKPFDDDFSEVYRITPRDNYEQEWTCCVVDLGTYLSDVLIVKNAKWVLFKK